MRWFVIVGACFVAFSFLFGVAEWCVDSGFGLVWDVYLGFTVSWFGGLYLYLVLLWIPGLCWVLWCLPGLVCCLLVLP